ncbi:MAG: type restriction enzyme protein [Acidobacteriota bacterium]|jgi:hypothetical protein|nr:type restriction enzyme protein [Acidobacteriota bacterium]
MSNHSQQIVQKLWNYCNVLRDDGLSYGDYVEQLTFLLFLKMAHERTLPPWSQPSVIPRDFDWPSLRKRDGDGLETHYRHLLEELGKKPSMLGFIFRKAQNKIQGQQGRKKPHSMVLFRVPAVLDPPRITLPSTAKPTGFLEQERVTDLQEEGPVGLREGYSEPPELRVGVAREQHGLRVDLVGEEELPEEVPPPAADGEQVE